MTGDDPKIRGREVEKKGRVAGMEAYIYFPF